MLSLLHLALTIVLTQWTLFVVSFTTQRTPHVAKHQQLSAEKQMGLFEGLEQHYDTENPKKHKISWG